MIVFICTTGADTDRERAALYACCERELEMGNIPIAPQLLFASLDVDAADAFSMGLEALERSDALHVYGEWTPRMKEEIEYAESIGIPVVAMDEGSWQS